VWSLLSRLDADRYALTLACPPHGDLVSRVKDLNQGGRELIDVMAIPSLVRNISARHDAGAFLRLYREISRRRFDVAHFHSSKIGVMGRLAAALRRIPLTLLTAHGWAFDQAQGRVQRGAYAAVERLAAVVTSRVICVCEADRRKAMQWRVCRSDKLAMIHNGVEESPPVRGRLRSELGLRTTQLVVGTVMRLARPKRPEALIHAAALLKRQGAPPFTTVIVGDGPLLDQCRRLAGDLDVGGQVRFLGERGDARVLMNDFDVFTLFSRSEGLPLSAMEAMHSARPVVATDVGGVPELVIHGKTGFIVPADDPAAAAPFIARLLNDEGLRASLGRAGARRARELFSVERMVRQYAAEYDAGRGGGGLP
jgi:glycosyltransferase involved in cell wall biosynthesis